MVDSTSYQKIIKSLTPKDAIHLLHKAGCPQDVIAHARAVAECAREIAERYNERHRNPADI